MNSFTYTCNGKVESCERVRFNHCGHCDSLPKPQELSPLDKLEAWAAAERRYWEGRNADRYWQMNRVCGQIENLKTHGTLLPSRSTA